MDLSIFLSRYLGIYMLIVAALWVIRKEQIIATFKEMASSNGFLMVLGIINLMLGLFIVIAHPFFEFSWVGLITLIGYLAVIAGIIRIAYPQQLRETGGKILESPGYWVVFGLLLVLGLFLTYSGFAAGPIWG